MCDSAPDTAPPQGRPVPAGWPASTETALWGEGKTTTESHIKLKIKDFFFFLFFKQTKKQLRRRRIFVHPSSLGSSCSDTSVCWRFPPVWGSSPLAPVAGCLAGCPLSQSWCGWLENWGQCLLCASPCDDKLQKSIKKTTATFRDKQQHFCYLTVYFQSCWLKQRLAARLQAKQFNLTSVKYLKLDFFLSSTNIVLPEFPTLADTYIHLDSKVSYIQNIRVVSDQWIPSRKCSQHKHTNYSPEQLVQWPSCPAALANVKSVGKDLGSVAIGVNLHTCLKRNKAIGYQQDNNMTFIERATICSLITSKA